MVFRNLIFGVLFFTQSQPVRMVRVSGIVTDNAGAFIPSVTIAFKAKKYEKEIVTSDDGRYELDLPAGTYEVRGSFQGCKDFRLKQWNAGPDASNTLNMSLYCPPTPIY